MWMGHLEVFLPEQDFPSPEAGRSWMWVIELYFPSVLKMSPLVGHGRGRREQINWETREAAEPLSSCCGVQHPSHTQRLVSQICRTAANYWRI